MTKTRWSFLAAGLLSMTGVACSDGVSRFSPIGPSTVVSAPAPLAVTPMSADDWASARGWATMADGRVAVADGVQVEGADVITDVSGACPDRSITIRGVAVSVNASTRFAAPLSCASLASGRAVKVTGMLTPSGAGFSVVATQLASAGSDAAPTPPPGRNVERVSGEGVIGAVMGSCPALTLVIGGYQVQTTSVTAYEGGRCESLREGVQVRLDVEKQSDGALVAETVQFVRVSGAIF
jgi:hypothetical protein